MNRFKKTIRPLLSKFPQVERLAERTLWKYRMCKAHKRRSRETCDLFCKYKITPNQKDGPRHIVFIVLDALRKDHLSLYGYDRETTPFLKSLAREGAVFENAFTAGSWTFPSVASMLTGLYPHKHGGMHTAENLNDLNRSTHFRDSCKMLPNKVHQDVLALPEILAYLGYDTHICTSMVPAALPCSGWFKNSSIFYSGCQNQLGCMLSWLRKKKNKKTFTYLHVGDLHEPINVPADYMQVFGEIENLQNLRWWEFKTGDIHRKPSFERYRQNRTKLYDCALRFLDDQVSKILNWLDEKDLRACSLVFITADHGEEFWDHVEIERALFIDRRGFYGISHSHNLFQEVVNVPLICIGPGVNAAHYIHNVSLVDLLPTVLNLCNIKHELEIDGRNLFSRSEERVIISEATPGGYEKKAIIKNNWKLIYSEGDGVSLLFDLAKDPREKHNLAETKPEKLQELIGFLPKTEAKSSMLEATKDVERRLRYLGYI